MSKYIFFLFSVIYSSYVFSKVSVIDFNEFLNRSDVILHGQLVGAFYDKDGSGYALIEPRNIIKGDIQFRQVRLSWKDYREVSSLSTLLEEYIFFLKEVNGEYVFSVYGNGVWRVIQYHQVPDGSVIIPTAARNIPLEVYTKPGELDCVVYNECQRNRITIKTFMNYFNKIKVSNK